MSLGPPILLSLLVLGQDWSPECLESMISSLVSGIGSSQRWQSLRQTRFPFGMCQPAPSPTKHKIAYVLICRLSVSKLGGKRSSSSAHIITDKDHTALSASYSTSLDEDFSIYATNSVDRPGEFTIY
jgi:hypothetical protein